MLLEDMALFALFFLQPNDIRQRWDSHKSMVQEAIEILANNHHSISSLITMQFTYIFLLQLYDNSNIKEDKCKSLKENCNLFLISFKLMQASGYFSKAANVTNPRFSDHIAYTVITFCCVVIIPTSCAFYVFMYFRSAWVLIVY